MRDTAMLREDGFLGTYGRIFSTGDTQNMWWEPYLTYIQLTGTSWISDTENEEHRHNMFTGNTKPRKLKKMSILTAYIVQGW